MKERKTTSCLRLGISACLLGEKVRYDGRHRLIQTFKEIWSRFVTWVPVCPEAESGLGVPRPKIGLFSQGGWVRLKVLETGEDVTERMVAWIEKKLALFTSQELSGFILKSGSPSCGLLTALNYSGGEKTSGLFAAALRKRFPLLPMIEEETLGSAVARDNFVDQIVVYHSWQEYLRQDRSLQGLINFHTSHKLRLMANSVRLLSYLGQLLATHKGKEKTALLSEYEKKMIEALAKIATISTHTNVLQHIAGYFKKYLCPEEKQRLAEKIQAYHQGKLSREKVLTYLRRLAQKYHQPYLLRQSYLFPKPGETELKRRPIN
ncbi:MAG: DUF523 and DUF1722 domain-containing protein [Candidatus Omnitrophica bacterium]|nr:DUF523 and DUF1722 domain-containing protein [Candidatus Omnitrophota bacterium]